MTEYPMRISLVEKWLPSPSLLWVRLRSDAPISFHAGQYITIVIPQKAGLPAGDVGIAERMFSIASAPHDPYIDLFVRIYPGGVASEFFEKAKQGEQIACSLPMGTFILPKRIPDSVTCIAAGTGVAPLYSMVREALEVRGIKTPLSLVFCVSAGDSFFLAAELQALARAYTNFSFSVFTDDVHSIYRDKNSSCEYFVCGSTLFVSSVKERLLALGVLSSCIHTDQQYITSPSLQV